MGSATWQVTETLIATSTSGRLRSSTQWCVLSHAAWTNSDDEPVTRLNQSNTSPKSR
jgi:hypothetical protein